MRKRSRGFHVALPGQGLSCPAAAPSAWDHSLAARQLVCAVLLVPGQVGTGLGPLTLPCCDPARLGRQLASASSPALPGLTTTGKGGVG